jgi:cytoskeletal protein RodZ
LAEEHGGSRSDAGRKPSSRRTEKNINTQGDDPRFEEFLRRQFSQLRHEIDQHMARSAKSGKVLSFQDGVTRRKKKSPWLYSVAAVVLAAVAVPMVLQLNRQKAEFDQKTDSAPAATGSLAQNQKAAPEDREAEDIQESAPARHKAKKKSRGVDADTAENEKGARNLAFSREETVSKDAPEKRDLAGMAGEKKADPAAKPADNRADGYAKAEEAPAPRAAPASPAAPAPATAKSRSAAPTSEGVSGGAGKPEASDEISPGAPLEAASRSVTIDDAKERIKKQDIAEDEKAEMEKLWKEFEKNPEQFSKDKRRSQRLKTLLARHETRSKSRAKRVKAAEAQYAQ